MQATVRRLVIRWQNQWKPELKAEGESQCTMELERSGSAFKLTIMLETGAIVLLEPYRVQDAQSVKV